jgi:hypothetical protein
MPPKPIRQCSPSRRAVRKWTRQCDACRELPERSRKARLYRHRTCSPNGTLFFEGGERIFPGFISKILADYKIAGNKFNAAGNSNGGLSAFLIAATYPQYFWSVTGFPGFLDEATPQRLAALKGLCIHMFVGGSDSGWPEEMRDQSTKLKTSGYNVTFNVEPGQPHVIRTLTGAGAARLYDQFDQARAGHCAAQK